VYIRIATYFTGIAWIGISRQLTTLLERKVGSRTAVGWPKSRTESTNRELD
jgi:hypothetical protein